MKCMNNAFIAAHNDDGIVANIQCHEVTLGRDLACHAGKQPLLFEDLLHIKSEQTGIVIKRLRKRKGAPPCLQHLGR